MTESRHYNWVPACGGTEPVTVIEGKRYQYMWNGVDARYGKSEHAYYCLDDDLFLEYDELPKQLKGY